MATEPAAQPPRVSRRNEPSASGLPACCRPRHHVRGSNVFVVPLWELPVDHRWLPEELQPSARTEVESDTKGEFRTPSETGNDTETNVTIGAVDQPDDDSAGSESDQSEVGWEGVAGETTRWLRAAVDGALVMLRRMPVAQRGRGVEASGLEQQNYGLASSAALFSREAIGTGDVALDVRLANLLKTRSPRWAVLALRSGHFAGAVFQGAEPTVHKAIHRYTTRAKQGGSQSTMDNSGKKPKSAGASLRRYGEQRLAEEIQELVTDKWAKELSQCELIFISVSRRMRSTLVGTETRPYVAFARIRRLPFMVGKPTFECVKEAYLKVASVVFMSWDTAEMLAAPFRPSKEAPQREVVEQKTPKTVGASPPRQEETIRPVYAEEDDPLYGPLHRAAAAGDAQRITELLDEGADPTARDGKERVPYYLCQTPKPRDAFRRWRGANEDAFDWVAARVPDGINDESEQRRKDKEREKKKKQKEKAKAGKAQAKEEEERAKIKQEEEAKLLAAACTKCDSCGKPVTAKTFSRLNFMYCSSECTHAHRRELQAEAALKRFGGGS